MVEAVIKDYDGKLTYADRIERLAQSGDVGAIQVKIADLTDNSDPERLSALMEDQSGSLERRHQNLLKFYIPRPQNCKFSPAQVVEM